MGKQLAVVYARNPLSVTDDELQAIEDIILPLGVNRAEVRPNGDGGPPSWQVIAEGGRGDEVLLGTFEDQNTAEFFVQALKWLYFFPTAVRELRAVTENAANHVATGHTA